MKKVLLLLNNLISYEFFVCKSCLCVYAGVCECILCVFQYDLSVGNLVFGVIFQFVVICEMKILRSM